MEAYAPALMIVRFGLLLSCVTLVVAQGQPAFAATPSQAPPLPQRIMLVGDSTAETDRRHAPRHNAPSDTAGAAGVCAGITGQPA